MEIIFCKTKKLWVVMLLVLLITISITTVVQAAENITVGKEYKYNGTGLVIFKTAKAANWMNVLAYGKPKWLYPGSIIKVLAVEKNAVKIGDNLYININFINKKKFDEHIRVTGINLNTEKLTIKIEDEPIEVQLKAVIEPKNATK